MHALDPLSIPRIFSGIMDSGATHTAGPAAHISPNLSDVRPSDIRFATADGIQTPPLPYGSCRLHIAHTNQTLPLGKFFLLPGGHNTLISLAQLTARRFQFWFTDMGDSLLLLPPPSSHAIVLRRQNPISHPDGLGLWYIDFSVTNNVITIHNDITAHNLPLPPIGTPSFSLSAFTSHDVPLSFEECIWHDPPIEVPNAAHTLLGATAAASERPSRRNRYTSFSGLFLHAALGHPSKNKIHLWKHLADGFPKHLPASSHSRCYGCRTGALYRRPVPDGTKTRAPQRTHTMRPKDHTVWFADFSRRMSIPDVYGNNGFALFTESNTLYCKAFLLHNKSDFWTAAQSLVDWVHSHHRTDIHVLSCDADPEWCNSSGSTNAKTMKCLDFEKRNKLSFRWSPPYTQARNLTEGRMKPVLALMLMQIQYAYLHSSLWGPSVLAAVDIHNTGPIMDTARPALKHTPASASAPAIYGSTPYTAIHKSRFDIRAHAAAFGCLTYVKVHGSKPSQLTNQSRPGLYFGLAPDTIGWRIFYLDTRKTTTAFHIAVEHDVSIRPVMLTAHDKALIGSPLSAGPALFNRAMRDLFDSSPLSPNPGYFHISPLTKQPVHTIFLFWLTTTTTRPLCAHATPRRPRIRTTHTPTVLNLARRLHCRRCPYLHTQSSR